MASSTHIENPDVILIGSGVMSANLAALLKRLDPGIRIQLYEVTDGLAQELGSVPCRYQRTGGILHPLETRAFSWRTPNPRDI